MIIPDLNLLIYAFDTDTEHHERAASWWHDCLAGSEMVGMPLFVLFGFARLMTMSRIFRRALTPSEAAEHVRSWIAQPVVRVLEPPAGHLEVVLSSLETVGTAGNLVTDAQIAALAIAHGAVVHTADADFLRFESCRWFNPLTGRRG